jgi:hypothetical protein
MKAEMKTKKCFKCHSEKALDEFYRHPMMADGRLNKCKECAKRDVRQHRRDHPDRLAAYERLRNRNPERQTARRRYAQASKKRNPQAAHARSLTMSAIRCGRLTPRKCESCGSISNIEAHHDDYYQPLKVRWLCYHCHLALHGKTANGERRFLRKEKSS